MTFGRKRQFETTIRETRLYSVYTKVALTCGLGILEQKEGRAGDEKNTNRRSLHCAPLAKKRAKTRLVAAAEKKARDKNCDNQRQSALATINVHPNRPRCKRARLLTTSGVDVQKNALVLASGRLSISH